MARPRTIRLIALAVFVYFVFFIVRMEFSLSTVDKHRHAKDEHIRNAAERHHRATVERKPAKENADKAPHQGHKLVVNPKKSQFELPREGSDDAGIPPTTRHAPPQHEAKHAKRDEKVVHTTNPATSADESHKHENVTKLKHFPQHTSKHHNQQAGANKAAHDDSSHKDGKGADKQEDGVMDKKHHQTHHKQHEKQATGHTAEPTTAQAHEHQHGKVEHNRKAHQQAELGETGKEKENKHNVPSQHPDKHAEKKAALEKKHHAVHKRHRVVNDSELVPVEGNVGFAVVISNEEYVDGALVLGVSFRNHSLLLQADKAHLIAIVPEEAVCEESIERLQIAGWNHIVRVPDLTKVAPKSHWAGTFNKLYMFNLTQFWRVATFDVDMLMLRNPDSVFKTHLPNESFIGALGNSHNKKHPYFQSGMMLIVPSAAAFESMMHDFHTDPVHKTINGRDGKIIRTYYKDRYINLNDDLSAHLGVHEPLDSVIGFHFRGEWKPWFNKEFPPTKVEYGNKDGKLIEQELGEAFRLWWKTYEHLHIAGFADMPSPSDAPKNYDPKKHVWLLRHTTQSYTQLLSDVDIAERNLTYRRLTLEKSKPGDSCDDVCSARQAICKEDALSFVEINSCNALKHYFGCGKCTMDYPGPDEPSYDHTDRMCYQNPLDYKRLRPNCSVSTPGRQRLCPCLPLEEAYQLPVSFDVFGLTSSNESMNNRPTDVDADHQVSGCYPSRGASFFQNDSKCVSYLSDPRNIDFITSVGRTLRIGRTAKLMAHYKENGVKAIIKVPQRKFPHEAQSEYIAYVVDRALGVYRVPPTAFVFLKHSVLRRGFENVTAQERNESLSFVEDEVWHHVTERNANYNKIEAGTEPSLGVSLQLWINDVHPMSHTNMTLPPKFHEMLVFEHHNKKGGKSSGGAPVPAKYARAVGELMRMNIFDFIIGNDDRRPPDKNTYVAGGCKAYCRGSSAFGFLDEPQVVYIDQGRSVHFAGDPEGNLLSSGTKDSDMVCRNFPKDVVQRALDLSHNISSVGALNKTVTARSVHGEGDSAEGATFTNTLERQILSSVDPKIIAVLQEERINMLQNRLERFLMHVKRCLAEEEVLNAEEKKKGKDLAPKSSGGALKGPHVEGVRKVFV